MAHVQEIWLLILLSFTEIAEKAGSVITFLRYRQNEEFMQKYDVRCREKFKALQAKHSEQMEILVEQGHWNATKYALDGNDLCW